MTWQFKNVTIIGLNIVLLQYSLNLFLDLALLAATAAVEATS
jgi:hypothetical protein